MANGDNTALLYPGNWTWTDAQGWLYVGPHATDKITVDTNTAIGIAMGFVPKPRIRVKAWRG
jgi:hypothetical protein